MSKTVVRLKDGVSLRDFAESLEKQLSKGFNRFEDYKPLPKSIAIAFKVGKKRKIKSFVLQYFTLPICDCCSQWICIELRKGDKVLMFDSDRCSEIKNSDFGDLLLTKKQSAVE